MNAVVPQKKVFSLSLIFMIAVVLNACSSGSPKYVGSIGARDTSQRTLDNHEISSIIKELRDDVVRQKEIVKSSKH